MTIYKELIERVSNGETFHIDLEKRTIKVGKKFLIKNGEYDTSRELFAKDVQFSINDILDMIHVKYHNYKYSLPSERSDKKRRTYFKALPMDQLTDKQLMCAERREIAQASLEGFILCMILENKFVWDENKLGKWFWQSNKDVDLVLLKKWIEKGE